ncbi:MAG: hypothetical protein FWG50_10725 [Kiritimatiellaeota bacterium]|nr:hypothetical protein [Kiritimatiellota bacterium]
MNNLKERKPNEKRSEKLARSESGELSWGKTLKVGRRVLIGSGAIIGMAYFARYLLGVLLGVGIVAILVIASCVYNPKQDVTNPASQHLARSVLNECKIGERRLKQVLHGYQSMPDFHGGHFGAYAMEISDVDVSTLTPEHGWVRGDRVNGEIENAVWNVLRWTKNVKWFPSEREVKSADIFVYSLPWDSLAFPLVLVRLSDKMVFYAYSQT